MKFLFVLIVSFFFILSISRAQEIEVNIKEVIEVEASSIDYNSTITDGKPFKVNIELFNPGSVGYNSRIRLDILDQDNLVFTGWSDEKNFFPGNWKIYDLYWHPLNFEGNLKASIRIYFANEIKKIKPIKFEVKSTEKSSESVFEILDFRTYDEEIEVLVKTNKTVENIVFIPSDYSTGWIFEQTKINKLDSGSLKIINLKYEPSLWKPDDVTISIFTEDGNYYTSQSFSLKRETFFWRHVHKIINGLRVFLKF